VRNPEVRVRMDPAFYRALCTFASAQDRSPANVLLHAGKAFLSKHHAWSTGTRGRPFAHVRKGTETGSRDPEVAGDGTSPSEEAVAQ
jgi:hypothetical protein